MTRVLVVHGGVDLYGSGLACAWMVEGARRAGLDVEVALPGRGPLADRLTGRVPLHFVDPVPLRGVSMRTAAGLLDPLRWVPHARRLRRLAAEGGFHLVHANTAQALGGLVASRAARVPLVWSVHEILRFRSPMLAVYERLLRRADVVTTCSRAAAEQFGHPAVRQRCRVLYTGAGWEQMPAETEVLAHPRIRLITVGRLVPWKGQDVVVRALSLLQRAGVEADLTVVGGTFGPDQRQLRVLNGLVTDLGLEGRVRLLGDRPDVPDLVAAADVFIQPSRSPEPFGIALVEAMSVGRVSIATNLGGPAEIIEDGVSGYLVPPDDPGALASLISAIDSNRTGAREVAARGRQRSRAFGREAMVEGIIHVYRSLA